VTRAHHLTARRLALALALSFALLPVNALAVPATELVQHSRTAAAREDWNSAARALEELVAAGIDSPDVLYDLGTVYARAERYGEAIWRLEQVNRRVLVATEAQQNLRAARLALAHRDAARSGRAVVETALPLRTALGELMPLDWSVAFALACELGAIACWLLWRRRRAGEIAGVASAAGAVLLLAASLFFASIVVARQTTAPAGIVLRDGVRLRHAPAADAIAEVAVREGERLELLTREAGFVRVRTPGGASGWLNSSEVGRLD
jgi:hypothetical protein